MPTPKEIRDLIFPEFANVPNGEQMHQLYDDLSGLAMRWRGTQQGDDAPLHLEIAEEYGRVFQQLVDMGWDWRHLDVESMLPDALMPDAYYETLSTDALMQTLLTYVRWWHMKIGRPTIAIHSFDKAYTRLLDLGVDPESILKPQNERESNVIWYGIPLSPEKYYERHPEQSRQKPTR